MKNIEIQARPTMYKGIRMRSRLEADYAASLDREGVEWEYEPVVFAGPDGQWLPDFGLNGESHAYIEVKPASQLDILDGEVYGDRLERIDGILRRMSVAWLTDPQAMLILDFWQYGDQQPVAHICGRPGVWTCGGRFPFAVLWPGMGQWVRGAAVSV